MTRASRRRRAALGGLVLPLALLLGACGGDDGATDAVASLTGDDTTDDSGEDDGTGTEPLTEEETQEKLREFAQCMRDHGVDMEDPQSTGPGGGGGTGGVVIRGDASGGSGDGPGGDDFEAANEACEPIIEDVIASRAQDLDPEEVERMQQQALEFAQCMRDNGVDMADPTFEDGGRMTQSLEVDPEDPTFQAAQEACATEGGPGGAAVPGFRVESSEVGE
jgi:hypothetical protein